VARVGLLGGTFNPPHIGHLIAATCAWEAIGLDRVLLVPTGIPPHKEVPGGDPGPEHRVAMCRLAVAADDHLGVSRIDVDRPGVSYTVDTLAAVHAEHPDEELTFIVGGDMAYSLPTWREPERILELATLAVAEREGLGRREISQRLDALTGGPARVEFFPMPRIDVSSSLLRERVAAGRTLRHLVPEPVEEYIAREGLYRSEVVA
jgi:nicotinate-nucleotide adenylyltransferase